jgi:hypothetical protein
MKKHFKGRCRKCGVFGHKAVDCQKKMGNGNHSFEGNKGKGPRGNFNKKAIKCCNCGLLGHMAKDCRIPKNEKVDRANKTVAGQIAHMVCDEEITEKEWKERARESLMCEDGWGDVESDSEDEGEDDEDELKTNERLEGLGGLLPQETESSKLAHLQDLSSLLMEHLSLENAPLQDVTPLAATTAPITDDLQERQVTNREGPIEPALANVSFCQCTMRTRAELELIKSSSDE